MLTQPMMHTMRIGEQEKREKPWRPVSFPPLPDTAFTTTFEERSKDMAVLAPTFAARPQQPRYLRRKRGLAALIDMLRWPHSEKVSPHISAKA
jgi:hypothetical protein